MTPVHDHQGCGLLRARGLLSEAEAAQLGALLSPEGPFSAHVAVADSVHVHLKVDDIAAFPIEDLVAVGGRVALTRPGYAKVSFASGIHLIASSTAVAEDDLGPARRPRPFVDHLGVDIRRDDAQTRALFDALPGWAAEASWVCASQGTPGEPVRCCYAGVAAKHWLFAPPCEKRFSVPIELAIGPLTLSDAMSGADLRPSRASACC